MTEPNLFQVKSIALETALCRAMRLRTRKWLLQRDGDGCASMRIISGLSIHAASSFRTSMTWFLARRDGDPADSPPLGPRVGLTAGKVLGKAHERNRIKRRMREVVRKHFELPAGLDLILHPRRQ
jgi:hypothetical protein